MGFTIEDAAKIAYGRVPDAGKSIQKACADNEDKKEAYAERRDKVFNAAYIYAHTEAGDEFFTEAMDNSRDLMADMLLAYQDKDFINLGALFGLALERQRKLLAERETVRIMNE